MTDTQKSGSGSGDDSTNAKALAGLAREVEGLRRALTDVEPLRKRVEDVAELVAQLSETTAAGLKKDEPAPAVSWLDLNGRGEAAERLLVELVDWLDRIFLQYEGAAKALPYCWAWHPDVVEELVWLMYAWRAAYEQEGYTSLAGDWHDRLRPGVVRRIAASAGMCSLEKHLTPVEPYGHVPLAHTGMVVAAWWGSGNSGLAPVPSEDDLHAVTASRKGTRDTRHGART